MKIELQKIPLAMVDPRWLSTETETGRKFRHLQYIADWIAGETDVVVAEDEGADDGGDEEDDVEE